jgi:hypothetical protein
VAEASRTLKLPEEDRRAERRNVDISGDADGGTAHCIGEGRLFRTSAKEMLVWLISSTSQARAH